MKYELGYKLTHQQAAKRLKTGAVIGCYIDGEKDDPGFIRMNSFGNLMQHTDEGWRNCVGQWSLFMMEQKWHEGLMK